MEMYLEGEEPTVEQLEAAIRRATIADKLTPVLRGTAFKNKGVQPLLDAVVRLPAVAAGRRAHRGPQRQGRGRDVVERQPDDDEPFAGAGVQDRDATRTWAS